MKIQSKFLIASTISAICVLLLACVTQWTSSIKLDQTHLIGTISTITQRHMEADMMHDAIRGDVLSAIIASEEHPETIDAIDAEFAEHYKNLRQNLEENKKEALPDDIKNLFATALVALNNYGGAASELIPFMKTKAPYKDKLENFNDKFKELEKENELISDKITSWSEQVTIEASHLSDYADTATYILTIIAVLSTLFIPYYAYKIIFSPQKILTEAMNRLANNDLSVAIEGADRNDEIGEIANALVIFRTNAREKIKLQEDQKAAELRNAEEQAAALKRQEDSIIEEISGILEACANGDFSHRLETKGRRGLILKLSEGMNKICEVCLYGLSEVKESLRNLSNGDLTKSMAGNHHGIFSDIQDSVNTTIGNLSNMVAKIRDVSISVSSASSEIASGSVDLSSRTEQQASTLEETSASMEQLTTAVRQNTQSAREANTLSEQSFKCAEVGGMIAKTAVDSIIKIQESSQKITDIISTIDDIAFQTNLLALNASVEAARAGEAGKGFAVVASEVRSLASRSAAASKEIKELIGNSMNQVNHGVELVNQSGKSLEDIISSIKSLTAYVARIVKSSEDQASGIEEINCAVSQIDEATQQNAALVEQNSAASQAMSELGKQLYDLITFFKIQDSTTEDEIRRISA